MAMALPFVSFSMASAVDKPIQPAVPAHEAGRRFSEFAFQHLAPRHERKLATFHDHPEPSARKVNVPPIDAFDPCPGLDHGIGKIQPARKLAANAFEVMVA